MAKAKQVTVLGIDFGTDSVRAIVIDARTGKELGNHVAEYPRWKQGLYCDPAKNQFRQHPLDYVESFEAAVKGALKKSGTGAGKTVVGIGVDTTGSTPCAVDKQGAPLAMTKGFAENPNAMFVLWKDHTAVREAEEINKVARSWGGTDFTKYEGGIYSSEWFWAKILHVLRADKGVRKAAFSWMEHCDWMAGLLTGSTDPLTLKRSRCAAGHKAMWHAEWGGLPDQKFLTAVDPLLAGLRARLYTETFTSDVSAGGLTDEWARRLGLDAGIPVAVGAFDAHMGGVGGGVRKGTLTKIMGTSTCDMIVAPDKEIGGRTVAGICGQVDGSIVPGLIGLEAGQSAFGDVYAWFANVLSWPLEAIEVDEKNADAVKAAIRQKIIAQLGDAAAKIPLEETGLLALDWLNGRRTPDADQSLKGAIVGLSLGSSAPRIYRALVEATAFGARAIVERFREQGVKIKDVVALGGIAAKSSFVMQVSADVMNMAIRVTRSEQSVALGAGMFAAVVAGVYRNVEAAQKGMGSGYSKTYRPDRRNARKYDELYRRYLELGEKLAPMLRAL
jgi:L-ribulokinase